MNDSKISVRYAKALFESAKDKEVLDNVREDMLLVQQLCAKKEFQSFLDSPVMKISEKCGVMNGLLAKKVNQLTM